MKTKLIAILFAILTFATLPRFARAADAPISPAEKMQLMMRGAQLWPLYCNTCHNARPGSEKAPYEWDQVVMHMRELGNIPPQDAKALLIYLKAK